MPKGGAVAGTAEAGDKLGGYEQRLTRACQDMERTGEGFLSYLLYISVMWSYFFITKIITNIFNERKYVALNAVLKILANCVLIWSSAEDTAAGRM